MNLLLDTHVLLWWLDDDPKLSEKARVAISDGEHLVFVSAVTVWEIRIKEALGKLDIPRHFQRVLEAQPFERLDITADHAHAIKGLPMHHRDPFDRMLVVQAQMERLTLVSHDVLMKPYKVALLEA